MDDRDKVIVEGTATSYRNFLAGIIWKDLKRELTIWYENAAKQYDNAANMETVCRIQGRREACEYILQLPEQILEQLEIDEEEANAASVKNSTKGDE